MKKAYDISGYTNTSWDANWIKSEGIDSLIIRLGYGGNKTSQDDKLWQAHTSKADSLGIPYSLYLYSYSNSIEYVDGDIAHSLRIAKQCNPKAIFYDVEDPVITANYSTLTQMISYYIQGIQKAGYEAGWYASDSWRKYRFNPNQMPKGTIRWIAAWDYRPDLQAWDIWQYASKSSSVGGYDCNYYPDKGVYDKLMTGTPPEPTPPPTPIEPTTPPEDWQYRLTYDNLDVTGTNAISYRLGSNWYNKYIDAQKQLNIVLPNQQAINNKLNLKERDD